MQSSHRGQTSKQKFAIKLKKDMSEFIAGGGVIKHPTSEDNASNKSKKSTPEYRAKRGKLTEDQVKEIRRVVTSDLSMMMRIRLTTILSKKFVVNYYTVRSVVLGETWKGVA